MLDLFRQHFDFSVEKLVSRRTGPDLDDQRLGAVMLDLRFLEEPLLDMTFAGWIKDLLLDQRMHHQLGADLHRQLRFLIGIRGLFKGAEQLFDMSMVRLQQFRRVGVRSCAVFRILCVSRIALWICRALASGAFARLVGSDLSGLGLGLCHNFRLSVTGSGSKFYWSDRPLLGLVGKRASGRAITESPLIYVHPLSWIESRSQWSACTGNIPSQRPVPPKKRSLRQLKFASSRN
jgi:hypothetical protein